MSLGGGDQEDAIRKGQGEYNNAIEKGMGYAKDRYQEGRNDIGDWYNKGSSYLDPYTEAGRSSLGAYMSGLGLGGEGNGFGAAYEKFQNSPGYQAALREGQKQVERSAAAGGRTQGGAIQKELARYGQDYASQQYGSYMDRLGQMAGMGGNLAQFQAGGAWQAGNNLAGLGSQIGGNIMGAYGNIGENNANAELAISQANAKRKKELWGGIGSVVGGAGGMVVGGPTAGAAGAGMGSNIGGFLGGG